MNKLQIEELIDEISNEISKKANECCYRSDGWEEDIKTFTKNKLIYVLDRITK